MNYIPLRVKNIVIGDDKVVFTVSFFETKDDINEFIPKEYVFNLNEIIYVSLGYIKNVEQVSEETMKISKMFKKIVSFGLSDEKKEKNFNLREEILMDFVVFKDNLLFFRLDLTTFNYKDFLKSESTFSSFINMRKFIFGIVSKFEQEKIDDIVFNFLTTNSLGKIQYFSSVYEFQDYVISKMKEKKIYDKTIGG
ncbi:MAG: hypothetical protein RMJ36_00135 [Candidatus Calescibacterium sp.]|nr:hypothetical protein [Candidatus Calescibacterium sp.]MDW8132053.1 hypothetical protein [Candidatus Calescibacterium sp.]